MIENSVLPKKPRDQVIFVIPTSQMSILCLTWDTGWRGAKVAA